MGYEKRGQGGGMRIASAGRDSVVPLVRTALLVIWDTPNYISWDVMSFNSISNLDSTVSGHFNIFPCSQFLIFSWIVCVQNRFLAPRLTKKKKIREIFVINHKKFLLDI